MGLMDGGKMLNVKTTHSYNTGHKNQKTVGIAGIRDAAHLALEDGWMFADLCTMLKLCCCAQNISNLIGGCV